MATVATPVAQSIVTINGGRSAIAHILTLPLADEARLGRVGWVANQAKDHGWLVNRALKVPSR